MIAAVRRFGNAFRSRYRPDDRVGKVLDWLSACQTPSLGGRKLSCACGWQRCVYNSCGNRHCPQCRGGQRRAWLVARTEQLLSVGHFHVVATLPGPLRAIARLNPALVYGALFRCLADTLQRFARQKLHAELGISLSCTPGATIWAFTRTCTRW